MKKIRLRICFAVVLSILLALLATGCGSQTKAAHGTPETVLIPTQNPLVAQYTAYVFGHATVWVEFGTDISYGRQTWSVPSRGSIPNNSATILVAGMKPGTTYHMRAHVDWADGASWVDQDQTFTTGALAAGNAVNLTVTRPVQPTGTTIASQQGVELLDLIAPSGDDIQAAVSDLDGNIIWYYEVDASHGLIPFPLKPLDNGNMLVNVFNAANGPEGEVGSTVREVDLAGNTIREISSANLSQQLQARGYPVVTIHHDLLALPNGHLILLCDATQNFTDLAGYPGTTPVVGDLLVDLDPGWKPVWVWSAFDHLDVNRHVLGLPDWTHSNAVLYTPNDGNLLLSVRNQSWIIKIDYENGNGSGNVLWRLGEGGDFSITGNDPSQWFYAQHYPNLLSINGSQLTLAVFDNGNLRVVDDSGTQCGVGNSLACYSRAVVFQVDETARMATPLWQYSPAGLFSPWGGSIALVDNGNVEFDMSAPFGFTATKSRVIEVTQEANPALIWQMDIDGVNAYRAYRIPSLYPGVTWNQ